MPIFPAFSLPHCNTLGRHFHRKKKIATPLTLLPTAHCPLLYHVLGAGRGGGGGVFGSEGVQSCCGTVRSAGLAVGCGELGR